MQRQSLKWLKPLALAGALLSLVPLSAAHAACGGGPGVFNSWGTGGKIAISSSAYSSSTATCNVSFTGGGNVNVETTGFIEPTWIDTQNNNKAEPACSVLGEAPKNPKPTGVTLERMTLPTFPSDKREVDIKYTHPNAFISVGDDPIGDQGQGCLDNASATCRPYQFITQGSKSNWKLWPNVNNKDPSFTTDDGATFPDKSGDPLVISNNVQNVYDEIVSQSAKLYFKYDGTRPFIINRFSASNHGNTITFEPGDYYFNDYSFGTTTVLNIAGTGNGTGKVNIFIKNASGSTFVGSGSCLNIQGVDTFEKCVQIRTDINNGTTPALSPPYDLNAQHPEKLAFWLYGGKLKLDDTIFVSASIYNDDPNGEVEFSANNRTTFVGEIVSKNIRTNNQWPVFMHYKDTDAFTELYEDIVTPKTGLFSPAAPAVPTVAVTGDYAFIVEQTEYNQTSTPTTKWGGYLKAYPFLSTGATATTASWTFGNADWDTVNTGNTPKERLSTSWDSFVGLPNTTQPKIYKDKVLFTTSDGNLYNVKRSDGTYTWHWTPSLIKSYLTSIADTTVVANNTAYETFLKNNPMYGQLAVYALSGRTQDATADDTANPKGGYILGTAMGGAVHYVVGLTNTGTVDATKVWEDNRQADNTDATSFAQLTATSPNAAAPVVYGAFGSEKVLYIVNNRLVEFDLGSAPPNNKATDKELVFKASSTPMVASKAGVYTIYIGATTGDVYTSDDNKLTGASNIGAAEPVKYLGFTTMSDNDYITAQSTKTITVFRLKKGETGWVKIWSSTLGSSSVTDSDGTATIPSLPSVGSISDKAVVVGGVVFVPFEGAENETTCMANAYMYMFDLDPVLAQTTRLYNTYYYGDARTSAISLGYGQAHAPQPMVFEGKLHVQGSSEQNAAVDGGRVGGGLDNPVELRAVKSLTGRRGWKELIED